MYTISAVIYFVIYQSRIYNLFKGGFFVGGVRLYKLFAPLAMRIFYRQRRKNIFLRARVVHVNKNFFVNFSSFLFTKEDF